MRGRGVHGEQGVHGVQRPAAARRVPALDVRARRGGAVRRFRGGARGAGRVGGVGAQPGRGRDGRGAGARRRAVVVSGRVGGPDVQHLRVRARRAGADRVPGVGPRRRARRRRPRQGVRHAEPGRLRRRRRAEPGVAGRRRRHRRRPRAARHDRRQPRRQGEAGPTHTDHRRRLLLRRRRHRQEAQHPWIPQRRELGNPAAHGSDLGEVSQDLQIGGPGMVLPPCQLPADRLRRRRRRLGHRHQPRQHVQWDHLHSPPQHRHHCLCSWYPTNFCAVLEAQEGEQVQGLLEHVPPLRRLHRDHTRDHQHLQGDDHPRRRAAVEDGLRRRPLPPWRRRRRPGGHHMGHGGEEAQGREKDLQQRLHRPPASPCVNFLRFITFGIAFVCVCVRDCVHSDVYCGRS